MGQVGLLLLTLALQPTAGTIRGVVLDTANGTGVARVPVRLQTDGRTVVTGEDGRFEIAGVPPGTQELHVSAVDFILVKRVVTVTAGAATDVTIVLSEGVAALAETVDVRANRTFNWSQKRLTLFVEAINVANRDNVRFALPSINRRTFAATGVYERTIPLIPAIGILLDF